MRKVLRSTLSERSLELMEGEMGKLMKILVEKKDIISLGPGEPDFSPPAHVISAARSALTEGYTHYSPVEGRKDLREEIAKKLRKKNGIHVDPGEIMVSVGSNEALLLSMLATIDPGEQVLMQDPGYIAYMPMVELLNGQALSIPMREEDNFALNIEAVKWQLKEPKRVRAIILNTPGNPTGSVIPKKTLEEIAGIAVENDLLIISDEAYEDFVYKGKHISIGSLNGMKDYVLSLFSFSKSYGMAGFRVGYAAGPKKLIDTMSRLHLLSGICAPTVSQMAALAALKGPQSSLKKNLAEYKRRGELVHRRINQLPGFHCPKPEGAFYAFPHYDYKMDSKKFAGWLIDNAKVAAVPGHDFGRYGEGHLRFSFATDYKLIEKAMDRIEHSLKKIKK